MTGKPKGSGSRGGPGKFIYRGPVRAMPKPKRSANNVCDREGCGHFRSDHRWSHECRVVGCTCEEMVW